MFSISFNINVAVKALDGSSEQKSGLNRSMNPVDSNVTETWEIIISKRHMCDILTGF